MLQKRQQSWFHINPGPNTKGSQGLQSNYYPAYLDLKGKKCVVVGGGKIAERKVKMLLRAGASVHVISPEITGSLRLLKTKRCIRYSSRIYRKGDLKNAWLTIAATSEQEVNIAVSEDAPFLVNVIDAPELANFITPALVQTGPLQIAVSTGGSSPAMAASIRRELELLFDKNIGQYLSYIGKMRRKLFETVQDTKIREGFFKIAGSPRLLDLVRKRGFNAAKKEVMQELSRIEGLK